MMPCRHPQHPPTRCRDRSRGAAVGTMVAGAGSRGWRGRRVAASHGGTAHSERELARAAATSAPVLLPDGSDHQCRSVPPVPRSTPDRALDQVFARNDEGEYDAPAPVPRRPLDDLDNLHNILRSQLDELTPAQRDRRRNLLRGPLTLPVRGAPWHQRVHVRQSSPGLVPRAADRDHGGSRNLHRRRSTEPVRSRRYVERAPRLQTAAPQGLQKRQTLHVSTRTLHVHR